MKLSECAIGTLVVDPKSPQFVGHVIGHTYIPHSGMCVNVKWPDIEEWYTKYVKDSYPNVPWIQLGMEYSVFHPSNLEKYTD
jgi:hypothetical protein